MLEKRLGITLSVRTDRPHDGQASQPPSAAYLLAFSHMRSMQEEEYAEVRRVVDEADAKMRLGDLDGASAAVARAEQLEHEISERER